MKKLDNLKLIEKGGQKEVYSAVHPQFGKVVFKKIKNTGESEDRTRREIRAVALMNSEYIPKIFNHNCSSTNNQPFLWLIEEYIAGNNLRKELISGRNFTLKEVVIFLETLLKVSILAEEKKLIHRDIKPENIILDPQGKFWILDYGIARHLDLTSITPTENPYGLFTIGYSSSEQFRNFKKDIDIRADLFSIGIVAYELIKGNNFYMQDTNGDVFKIIKKLETESLPSLRLEGDERFQLSAFIKLLGDHRRNRRPRSAQEAFDIFTAIKPTLNL